LIADFFGNSQSINNHFSLYCIFSFLNCELYGERNICIGENGDIIIKKAINQIKYHL
jgi:hypothetical protein